MASLVAQMLLAEKYGLRLNTDQLREVLGWRSVGSVRNAISAGTFPIRTYLAEGQRWADFRDVAEYLDSCRPKAAA